MRLKYLVVGWWLALNGSWPLVPYHLHSEWRQMPGGLVLLVMDWAMHVVGVLVLVQLRQMKKRDELARARKRHPSEDST